MAKNFPRTGKRVRPKTAVKGKRYRCASCRKRSPKPVKTPAPWYCPNCLRARTDLTDSGSLEALLRACEGPGALRHGENGRSNAK